MGNNTVRVMTFNISLHRLNKDQLTNDLHKIDPKNRKYKIKDIEKVAAIIQHLNPDILLINEIDGQTPENLILFTNEFLAKSQYGQKPILFDYFVSLPSNTGVLSNKDLNNDGKISLPEDAFGFGDFPGQYNMAILSKFPIDDTQIRSFQKFLWKDMNDAQFPQTIDNDTGQTIDWYSDDEKDILRLSSKNHIDVPIQISSTQTLHLLASHPTPPVFDGPEDRNGLRNYHEIKFWADYINPQYSGYIYDDSGIKGGLPENSLFIVLGDMNCDPIDGDDSGKPITLLLNNPLTNTTLAPTSLGAVVATNSQKGVSLLHKGPHNTDTSDFPETPGYPGNIRTDYIIPSANLQIESTNVFWPASKSEKGFYWIRSSDHRPVIMDIKIKN